jgi:hypothetical protein
MPTVRTTMQPDREIEVDDAEYLDLQRQGLLAGDSPGPVAEAATAPSAVTPKKTTSPAGSKEN